jgi:hypothetical protein
VTFLILSVGVHQRCDSCHRGLRDRARGCSYEAGLTRPNRCPRPPPPGQAALAEQSAGSYGSCMEVNDSDHKPVYCLLDVALPAFEQVCVCGGGVSRQRSRKA